MAERSVNKVIRNQLAGNRPRRVPLDLIGMDFQNRIES
jgi:hypothetical protein